MAACTGAMEAPGQTLDLAEDNKDIEWLVVECSNESQRMVSRGEHQET